MTCHPLIGYPKRSDNTTLCDVIITIARRELDKPGLAAPRRTQLPHA